MERTQKLEQYLRENITLEFCHPPEDKMSVVDNAGTEVTFVEFFFDMARGEFPENQNGYSKPPTQGMFATAFFSYHKDRGIATFTEEYRECWKRRCQVTYPSLIRDMHFAYLLQDYNHKTGTFDSVIYDPEKDVKEGADAIIKKDGKTYYVNLYVDTDKSHAFLEEKKDHRHPEHNFTEIHLPMSRHDSRNKKVDLADGSDIWLYTEEYIEEIVNSIS